ncbi:MAG: DsbA family protein [Anaerolineae bacterium]|nr:DsbA family protein [Anaerolineae bacterium]
MAKAKIKSRVKRQAKPTISPTMIVLVMGAALLIAGGLMVVGNQAGEVDVSRYPTKGQADAPVTIIEYSDYGCTHCRDFILNTLPLLEAEYVDSGKVKYVVHPYYLGDSTIGLATEAAWCAQDQGKFFEYQHALFENQGMMLLNQDSLVALANELGLDGNAVAQCLASGAHRTDVGQATQAAANRGVNSTPTFFINNRRIVGNKPYSEFQSIIERELAAAQ